MFERLKDRLELIVGRISAASQSQSFLVVIAALAVCSLCLIYVKNNVGINTDTENMLSEKLPWRTTYAQFKTNFPFFTDSIVIVTDAVTPDLAEDAARELAESIAADSIHFHSVFHVRETDFIRRNQFLYMTPRELVELSNDLSRSQAVMSQLLEEPRARKLVETLDKAVGAASAEQLKDLAIISTKVASAIDEARRQTFKPMSWQALLQRDTANDESSDTYRIIFSAKPNMDFSAILPAEAAIDSLRATIRNIEEKYPDLVNIRITGGAALAHDEMSAVISGSIKAGLVALAMVLACLFIGLRSWVLVISTLLSLLIGLTVTATFAVLAVGTLNMISIAFAVLYVGLGVDFAIHTCLRYKELLSTQRQVEKHRVLNTAVQNVGASIALCAVTTAIGFFAFIPTDFQGVAELGLIAGVGMFISLATSIVILPAILQILPIPRSNQPQSAGFHGPRFVTEQNAKPILVLAGCLWFLTSISVSFVSFDINPINLNDQQAESVKLIKELSTDGDFSLYAISVLVDDEKQLAETKRKLSQLVSVKSTTDLSSLIPKAQTEKLDLVDELALIIGDELTLNRQTEFVAEELAQQLHKLRATLATTDGERKLAFGKLENSLTNFLNTLTPLAAEQKNALLELLDQNLMTSLEGRINRLDDAFGPSLITRENLPPELARRWLSDQGKYRIEATPREDLSKNHSLKAFVQELQGTIGDSVTGTAIVNVGAAEAVQTAFIQAFSYSLILISLLLWIILRSVKEVIVTLFPLLLAGLITCAAVVLFQLEFNFANVIALPLLLGIGVDSAIHLLHRYKSEANNEVGLLQTSTAKAVFFSAATTTVSFGNLAVSNHAGTAGMGLVLTIGIISVLFCMLIVLPAMLIMFIQRPSVPAR
ncbi:MAG: MMPL family transporter [Gammaproteobacteria bacterium]